MSGLLVIIITKLMRSLIPYLKHNAMDQDWLEYVMLYAAGLGPGDYDATAYCPPLRRASWYHILLWIYTEYNEQEETSCMVNSTITSMIN